MTAIDFFVEGIPAPQGSKRHLGNGVLVESSKRVKPWRTDVRQAAIEARGKREPITGGVSISLCFIFPRPKGHFGTGRNVATLKPGAPTLHTVKPDLDKLERAIGDACTGVLWSDDSQIVASTKIKRYASPNERPGVEIRARVFEVSS